MRGYNTRGATPWVSFDLDGTLIDNPYWRLHFMPWLTAEAMHQHLDNAVLRRAFREEGNRRWRKGRWVDSFDWPSIAVALGLPRIPPPTSPHPEDIRRLVLPHVQSMLWSLRRRNIHLAIVTNGFRAFQLPYLKALGWDYLFDEIITPDLAGTAKPDPSMMRSLEPGLIHIGDRLTHDVLCAQRAGWKAILAGNITNEHDRIDPLSPAHVVPEYWVSDFHTIPAIIDRLLQE